MVQRHLVIGAIAALLGVILAVPLHAETAREVLDRRKALEAGARKWTDRQYMMKLHISGRGSDRERELVAYEKRFPGDERRTVIFFRAPAEVNGTAFLSIAKSSGPADQWIYMPELQRVRQVTARTRNESFVGTDLTYGDLDLMQEVVNWTDQDTDAVLRGQETVDGTPAYAIEFTPKHESAAYKKIVVWLGRDDLVVRQIEFYADGTTLTKRLRESGIKMVGSHPVAHTVDVETPSTGSHTTMQLLDVKYDAGVDDDLFTQAALERGER
jgi:outer membrane lipoprotein-sorting protein